MKRVVTNGVRRVVESSFIPLATWEVISSAKALKVPISCSNSKTEHSSIIGILNKITSESYGSLIRYKPYEKRDVLWLNNRIFDMPVEDQIKLYCDNITAVIYDGFKDENLFATDDYLTVRKYLETRNYSMMSGDKRKNKEIMKSVRAGHSRCIFYRDYITSFSS